MLNRAYVPVNITDFGSAISLLYNDKCKALDLSYASYTFTEWVNFTKAQPEVLPYVSTVNYRVAVPEIVVLTEYDRLHVRDVRYSRQNVLARDRYRCAYCGLGFKTENLNVDHILPKDKGGTSDWHNVITSCYPCNQKKGNKTLEEAGLKLKFKPRQPVWISPLQRPRMGRHCKSWSVFINKLEV